MIIYLLIIVLLPTSFLAMDKPSDELSADKVCAQLQGRGKFSPDGQKILVAQDIRINNWETKHGNLHILEVNSGKITPLEKSNSAALDPNKTYGHSYYKYSWSPQGTLIKARYFTDMQKIIPGQYDTWRAQETEDKSPMSVLKVWNTQGKLLYQRHHSYGLKHYFSADDQYLLVKERENPLTVYDATTGTKLAELGQPNHLEHTMPVDPQNRWLVRVSPDPSSTTLYDYQIFTPLRTIAARIEKFNTDGSLFLAQVTKAFDTPEPETCCSSEGKFLAYFCAIYNAKFEKIGIFNSGWMHRFTFSPCQKVAISYDHETALYVDIATNKEVARTTHPTSAAHFEYVSGDLTQKITLTPNEQTNSTELSLAHEGTKSEEIALPELVNHIFYTRIPEVVALAHYGDIIYLFNIKNKAFTPCRNSLVKGLFKHTAVHFVSQDGHYITRTDRGCELRKLELAQNNP